LALRPRAAAALSEPSAQALADVMPELAQLRPIVAGPMDVESRRALVLEGGVRVLDAATGGSCLVLVDDLQWADASSMVLLDRAVGRLAGLGLVLAYRPAEVSTGSPVAAFLAAVPDRPRHT